MIDNKTVYYHYYHWSFSGKMGLKRQDDRLDAIQFFNSFKYLWESCGKQIISESLIWWCDNSQTNLTLVISEKLQEMTSK